MVWFQCEDCGENLKKPKLQNHFWNCSANKLSCIDCGQMFSKQDVQSHTQCITEAEKYGPKGQGKASNGTPANSKKESKPKLDIDINVGLSSHAPWFCSLCNTNTTSKQTLLLHADGKKHRAKARAFHAKQQPSQTQQEMTSNEKDSDKHSIGESVEANCSLNTNGSAERISQKAATAFGQEAEKGSPSMKKRKFDASKTPGAENNEDSYMGNVSNGEVIQSERESKPECFPKKSKKTDAALPSEEQINEIDHEQGATNQKIKWKKLITSILNPNPDGVLKMRKLRKLASKILEESGITLDEAQLQDRLEHKINSSSRFILDSKIVRLVPKSTT